MMVMAVVIDQSNRTTYRRWNWLWSIVRSPPTVRDRSPTRPVRSPGEGRCGHWISCRHGTDGAQVSERGLGRGTRPARGDEAKPTDVPWHGLVSFPTCSSASDVLLKGAKTEGETFGRAEGLRPTKHLHPIHI